MNIGTVILATTDDIQFLHVLVRQAALFSTEIVLSFGNQFYNKELERESVISEFSNSIDDLKDVSITIVRYDLQDTILDASVNPSNYWHCHGRWVGIQALHNDIDYVLLLDADEVPEGNAFKDWLETKEYLNYDCMKMANYWYWREPIYRARNIIEDSIVFIKREHANKMHLTLQTHERTSTYDLCSGNKTREILGISGRPMFHHFSWVRTYKQMLRKVITWGHKHDRDYVSMVQEEFSHEFSGTERMRGYAYDLVPNIFNIVLHDNE